MRKVIGVLVLFVCVGGGIWMTINKMNTTEKPTERKTTQAEKTNDARSLIDEIDNKIENDYPEKVKGIIDIHNDLMEICYKYPMDETAIEHYTDTIRKIYSAEFLEINPKESQIEQLNKERQTMGEQNMELLASNIEDVYIAQDDKGEEVSAEVNVLHGTTKGSTARTYLLIKEDGIWKINGWKTTNVAK